MDNGSNNITKKYNKLVRDKQFEIFDNAGHVYSSKILTDPDEYLKELLRKLVEEAKELKDDPTNLEERADVQEVLNAIDRFQAWTAGDVEHARLEKHRRKGGFEYGLYLKEITKEHEDY